MNPYVESVEALDNYKLALTFKNGEQRIFDLRPYLKLSVFARLNKPALFKTARIVSGSVEWSWEIDLSYDTLYLESETMQPRDETEKKIKNKQGYGEA
jgi:hypothetical protein